MFFHLILTVCVLLSGTTALPAPDATTGRVAPRSYPSAGITCYFACPYTKRTNAGTADLVGSSPNQGVYFFCYYSDNIGCLYEKSTGKAFPDNADTCLAQVPVYGCYPGAANPEPTFLFRRGDPVGRRLTKKERIIRERQYKPKKAQGATLNRRSDSLPDTQ